MEAAPYIKDFFNWLQKQYSYKQIDNVNEITTPLTNNIGDKLRIYLEKIQNNKIRLSDDGVTLEDLELMGIDISSKTRKNIITNILNQYDISINDTDNTLYIDGSSDDFPLMKFNLINAMRKINDLTFTKKSNIDNLFFDDAFNFFKENDFRGVKDYLIPGGSGVPHKINYTIPASKKTPMNLIDLQNSSVTKATIMTNGFIYNDIKKNDDYKNENINYVIIYNSNAKLSNDVNKLALSANIVLIPWQDKSSILKLKAVC